MTGSNIKWTHASLWVQIWGAPFDMVSPQVALEVGSRFGVVEEVERRCRQDEHNFFMRVRVALPLEKPIRKGSFIAGLDGIRSWVKFKYERLPIFCHCCGLLGHNVHHCAQHFVMRKNGDVVEYQYGEWLKSPGGHTRSPPRQNTTHTNDSNDGVGQKTTVVESISTAELVVAEHHNLQKCQDDGKSVSFGINSESEQNEITGITRGFQQYEIYETVLEVQKDGHVNVGMGDNVSSGVSTDVAEEFKGDSTSNKNCDDVTSFPNDIWASESSGPRLSKAQEMWPRLNCMDFGLSDFTKALNLPTIGKRDPVLGKGTAGRIFYEEQTVKHGRFDRSSTVDNDISVGVVDHPCRKQ